MSENPTNNTSETPKDNLPENPTTNTSTNTESNPAEPGYLQRAQSLDVPKVDHTRLGKATRNMTKGPDTHYEAREVGSTGKENSDSSMPEGAIRIFDLADYGLGENTKTKDGDNTIEAPSTDTGDSSSPKK